jgi:hypothetical protein
MGTWYPRGTNAECGVMNDEWERPAREDECGMLPPFESLRAGRCPGCWVTADLMVSRIAASAGIGGFKSWAERSIKLASLSGYLRAKFGVKSTARDHAARRARRRIRNRNEPRRRAKDIGSGTVVTAEPSRMKPVCSGESNRLPSHGAVERRQSNMFKITAELLDEIARIVRLLLK